MLLVLLLSLAVVAAAQFNTRLPMGGGSGCAGVLFVLFGPHGEQVQFALSRDGRVFENLNHNGTPVAALLPRNGTSVRDPFVRRSPGDNLYHLVATNGAGFGNTPTILHWSSPDLVQWSPQATLAVMAPLAADLAYTWAPEWVWDAERGEHIVFWATQWRAGREHFAARCTNSNTARFTFWAVRTADWRTFSAPFELYDPACVPNDYAPDQYGDGGIDGDLWLDSATGSYLLFYKDSRAPKPTGVGPMQLTSGVRLAVSQPHNATGFTAAPNATLIGPWGTEGPELLLVNDTRHLYFDCSFQPTPPGYPRPPYGLATAPASAPLTDPTIWFERRRRRRRRR